MILYEENGVKSVMIPLEEYIELLQSDLFSRKASQAEDSSWCYGIEDLESKISILKTALLKKVL